MEKVSVFSLKMVVKRFLPTLRNCRASAPKRFGAGARRHEFNQRFEFEQCRFWQYVLAVWLLILSIIKTFE
jgi:hypothetical protein